MPSPGRSVAVKVQEWPGVFKARQAVQTTQQRSSHMSHPHAGDGAKAPAAGQSQTLFITAPDAPVAGILVTDLFGDRSQKPMRFADQHAALTWCLENRPGLIMAFSGDVSGN